MAETTEVAQAIQLLYSSLLSIAKLHSPVEIELEDGQKVDACEHCSEILSNTVEESTSAVSFPCPTAQLLIMEEATGSSEPAESEQPSA